MTSPFQTGGPLTAGSTSYIERDADSRILEHLRQMAYVLIIEPRQQGKTSLIWRTRAQLMPQDYMFVYVDITVLERSSKLAWPRLGAELAQQLAVLPGRQNLRLTKAADWFEVLRAIARQAKIAGKRVVIVLDEIGGLSRAKWSEPFFAPIRAIFNMREIEAALSWLTFVLCGCFNPRDLIVDPSISPFNVSKRVHLSDFTVKHVERMVLLLGLPANRVVPLAARIHHWTGGQPYLTQILCDFLVSAGIDADVQTVDRGVECLRREDGNHLPPLLKRLEDEPRLMDYLRRILGGQRIQFNPNEDRRHRQLELLGIAKADANGFCVVRNTLYTQVLLSLDDSSEANHLPLAESEEGNPLGHGGASRRTRDQLEEVVASHASGTAETTTVDPKFLKSLTDILLKIPTTSNFEGRTTLLNGVQSAQGLNRDGANARTDLQLIIIQLIGFGDAEVGPAPIRVFLENAENCVPGTEIAKMIVAARDFLSRQFKLG